VRRADGDDDASQIILPGTSRAQLWRDEQPVSLFLRLLDAQERPSGRFRNCGIVGLAQLFERVLHFAMECRSGRDWRIAKRNSCVPYQSLPVCSLDRATAESLLKFFTRKIRNLEQVRQIEGVRLRFTFARSKRSRLKFHKLGSR
jgi:hypothetical protein